MSRNTNSNRRFIYSYRMSYCLFKIFYGSIKIFIIINLFSHLRRLNINLMKHGIGSIGHNGISHIHKNLRLIDIIFSVHFAGRLFLIRKFRSVRTDIFLSYIINTTALKQKFRCNGPASVCTALPFFLLNIYSDGANVLITHLNYCVGNLRRIGSILFFLHLLKSIGLNLIHFVSSIKSHLKPEFLG